jgi:hypothetical protein
MGLNEPVWNPITFLKGHGLPNSPSATFRIGVGNTILRYFAKGPGHVTLGLRHYSWDGRGVKDIRQKAPWSQQPKAAH